jgi:hypothetical protein
METDIERREVWWEAESATIGSRNGGKSNGE